MDEHAHSSLFNSIRSGIAEARLGNSLMLLDVVTKLIRYPISTFSDVFGAITEKEIDLLIEAMSVLQHRVESAPAITRDLQAIPSVQVRRILQECLLLPESTALYGERLRAGIAVPLCQLSNREELLPDLLTLLLDADFTVHCAAVRVLHAPLSTTSYLLYLERSESQKARIQAFLYDVNNILGETTVNPQPVTEITLRVVQCVFSAYRKVCGWSVERVLRTIFPYIPHVLLHAMRCGDVLLELNAVEVLCDILTPAPPLPCKREDSEHASGSEQRTCPPEMSENNHNNHHESVAGLFLLIAREPFIQVIDHLLEQPAGHSLKCFAFRSVGHIVQALPDALSIRTFVELCAEHGWLDRILEEGWQAALDEHHLTAAALTTVTSVLAATASLTLADGAEGFPATLLEPYQGTFRAIWRRDVCNSRRSLGSTFDQRVAETLGAFAHLLELVGVSGWQLLFSSSHGGDVADWRTAVRETLLLRGNPEVRASMLRFLDVLVSAQTLPYSVWMEHLLTDPDLMVYMTYPDNEADAACCLLRHRVVKKLHEKSCAEGHESAEVWARIEVTLRLKKTKGPQIAVEVGSA